MDESQVREAPMKFGPFLRQYLKQSLEVFKHPLQLLPSILLTVVWIVLGILQLKVRDSLPLKVLNFLTYAQGGLYGGVVGAVGGILGKVVVATFVNALLVPLFQGKKPFKNLGSGIKELFKAISFKSMDTAASLFKGLGTALMAYTLFNLTGSFQNSLVGVVAAVSMANAVGRKGGFLWGLVFSYANSVSGGRTPRYQSVLRYLSGMTLGFTLGVGLSAAGLNVGLLVGFFLLIGGWILRAGTRKEAAASMLLALLCLLPQQQLCAQDDENPFLALMPKTLGAERAGKQEPGEVKGAWVLKDVETEVKSSGSRELMFWIFAISDLKISGTTDLDFNYSKTEHSTGETDSGHVSVPITKVKGPYAPGEGLIMQFYSQDLSDSQQDALAWAHLLHAWDNVLGEENEISCQSSLQVFFPSPDEVPDGQYIFTFSVYLAGAYVTNHYIFEWDNGKISLTLQDLADLTWWLEGGEGEHAPLEWTVIIALLTGFGGALGGGAAGGAAGAAAGAAAGGPVPPAGPESPAGGSPGDSPGKQPEPPPEEEVDDYDYEAERAERARLDAETNARYAAAQQKDWERFSTTSEQERITRETEEAMRQEEERRMYEQMWEEEEQRQKNVLEYAEKYGIPTTDADGNPREIWDIEHDTKRASMWEKNKGIYQDSLDIQQIASEVELRCSEKIAELELTDKVAEGTVNIMGEYVPGGKYVKDAHGFIKATATGGMEAYANGRSVTKGLVTGGVRGTVTIIQNHAVDAADAEGLTGATKFFATGTINVLGEAAKAEYESIEREDSWEDMAENIQNAVVKKTGEHLLNSGLGELGMSDSDANITTEFLMKGHDELNVGTDDNPKTISQSVTDTINDAKNNALGNVLYHTGLY